MQATLKIEGFEELVSLVKGFQDEVSKLKNEIVELKSLFNYTVVGDDAELTKKEVAAILRLEHTTSVNNKVNKGEFPPPDKKVFNRPVWKVKTVKTYLEEKDEMWKFKEWEKSLMKARTI